MKYILTVLAFLSINISAQFGFNKDDESNPKELFANGEQGVWYDPSDLSTLFIDSAGATPVTNVEQPVGLMLDKSGRGNHAKTTATTKRPYLSARYNLLTWTEDFSNAAWGSFSMLSPVAGQSDAFGTNKAYKLVPDTSNAQHRIQLIPTTIAASHTFIIYAKSAGYNYLGLRVGGDGTSVCCVNLSTQAITQVTGVTATAILADNNYTKITIIVPNYISGAYLRINIMSADMILSSSVFKADGTSGIIICFPDLRVSNDGVGLPAYQRVTSSTDYDVVGFPKYLKFDGIDDYLVTNSINFSSTDKMSVFAGVRKLSDIGQSTVAELSSSIASNNGAFLLSAPNSAAANFNFSSKGTTQVNDSVATYTSPITNTITGIASISSPALNSIRINGAQAGTSSSSQGTGNFSNNPIYIGMRAGTSAKFSGRLYQLIIRGALSNDYQIYNTEQFINLKTNAF